MPSTESARSANAGFHVAAISNMVVRVISEHTGRGPTKARTHLSEDLVTVVLGDTLTRGERTLARAGRKDLVLSVRQAFQEAMQRDLVAGVQDITGREVAAFMSADHIDPDMAVETFVLVSEVA
jgi:uncharacterized protein YbcI